MLVFLAFVAFLAYAPEQAAKLFLAGAWVLMLLTIPAVLLYELLR